MMIATTPQKQIIQQLVPQSPPVNQQLTIVQQKSPVLMSGGDNKIVQQFVNTTNQPQQIIFGGQRILLNPGQTIITEQQQPATQQVIQQQVVQQVVQQQSPQPKQQIIQPQVVQQVQQVVQQQQVIQQQPQQQQIIQTNQQQFFVNNANLAQQLAQGKLQGAIVNGQQLILKPLGNSQVQIVAHIKQIDGKAHVITNAEMEASAAAEQQQLQQQQLQQQQQQQQQQQLQQQQQQQLQQQLQQQQQVILSPTQSTQNIQPSTEQKLLQGQPPGTVIKCVTAKIIQTLQGPRIVLQGLTGNEFTPQQLALVQQQFKQQLLRAQETSGKEGVLGSTPTKIYLAVQPPQSVQSQPNQPPPLTPVLSPPQHQQTMN